MQILSAVLLVVLLVLLVLLFRELLTGAPEYPVSQEGIRPLHVILGPGVGNRPFFDGPMGVTFGADGRIYVADSGNHRVVVFDSEGEYLFQFGGLGVGKPAAGIEPSWKPGLFNYPTDICSDDVGNIYVADFRNDQIQVFDADGDFLRVFPDRNEPLGRGASGQDGAGIAVTSLTVHGERVYATDTYQVAVFSTEGELLDQFGRPGAEPGDLDHPNGIAVGAPSVVVVSNSNRNQVLAFAPGGRFMWSFGKPLGNDLAGLSGELELPRGLTIMDDGTVLVADALADSIVRLTLAGEFDGRFGTRGAAPGQFNAPMDVDEADNRLAIAEKGNDRVQVIVIED
ncbi:MAG: hypothetical protein P1P71_03695 [Anaerosomatales bacterium]|nr:hypothetical protein [Anaerosomatales bacterium]